MEDGNHSDKWPWIKLQQSMQYKYSYQGTAYDWSPQYQAKLVEGKVIDSCYVGETPEALKGSGALQPIGTYDKDKELCQHCVGM